MKDNILTARFIKKNKKLSFESEKDEIIYKKFVESLEENQSVEVFMEACKNDGTLVQLAKIHACLKKIAQDTGSSVLNLKIEAKRRAGLTFDVGDGYTYIKSLANCSREELSLVIEEIKEMASAANVILDSDFHHRENQSL